MQLTSNEGTKSLQLNCEYCRCSKNRQSLPSRREIIASVNIKDRRTITSDQIRADNLFTTRIMRYIKSKEMPLGFAKQSCEQNFNDSWLLQFKQKKRCQIIPIVFNWDFVTTHVKHIRRSKRLQLGLKIFLRARFRQQRGDDRIAPFTWTLRFKGAISYVPFAAVLVISVQGLRAEEKTKSLSQGRHQTKHRVLIQGVLRKHIEV